VLLKEIGRILINTGTKIASRISTMVKGLESFIGNNIPANCWEFFYICTDPSYTNEKEYWEEIIWGTLSLADRNNQPIWTYFTDYSRLDLLKNWSFGDIQTGWCVENKVPMWGAIRKPAQWNVEGEIETLACTDK